MKKHISKKNMFSKMCMVGENVQEVKMNDTDLDFFKSIYMICAWNCF